MIIVTVLSLLLVVIDQISKILILNNTQLNDSIEIIKNFFYITYTHNTGAAFSILLGKRIFLILITIIVLVILFNYIKKNKITRKIELISLSLVVGGSLGNLIDRIIRGYVIDFIDIKIFGYDFPIFNIADSFITIGVILLILTLNRKEKKNES